MNSGQKNDITLYILQMTDEMDNSFDLTNWVMTPTSAKKMDNIFNALQIVNLFTNENHHHKVNKMIVLPTAVWVMSLTYPFTNFDFRSP